MVRSFVVAVALCAKFSFRIEEVFGFLFFLKIFCGVFLVFGVLLPVLDGFGSGPINDFEAAWTRGERGRSHCGGAEDEAGGRFLATWRKKNKPLYIRDPMEYINIMYNYINTSNLQQSWGAEVSKKERDYRKK